MEKFAEFGLADSSACSLGSPGAFAEPPRVDFGDHVRHIISDSHGDRRAPNLACLGHLHDEPNLELRVESGVTSRLHVFGTDLTFLLDFLRTREGFKHIWGEYLYHVYTLIQMMGAGAVMMN